MIRRDSHTRVLSLFLLGFGTDVLLVDLEVATKSSSGRSVRLGITSKFSAGLLG